MNKISQGAVFKAVPEGAQFAVYRWESPLKTPAGLPFVLPTPALAEAIAAEWQAQQDKISEKTLPDHDPTARRAAMAAAMPFTQLAATAIDIVSRERDRVIRQLASYATTELLCYRANAPDALVKRQQEIWQPYLDWCAERFAAVLAVGIGIMPVQQPLEVIDAFRKAIMGYNDFFLAGLSCAVDATGSLVLGLALTEGTQNAEAVFEAAELDSSHQSSEWGEDPVTQARYKAIRQELKACEKWFGLLKAK